MSTNTPANGDIEPHDLALFVKAISVASPRTDAAAVERQDILAALALIANGASTGDVADITDLRDRMLAFIRDEKAERAEEKRLKREAVEGSESAIEDDAEDEEIAKTRGNTLLKVVEAVEEEKNALSQMIDAEEKTFANTRESGLKQEDKTEIAKLQKFLKDDGVTTGSMSA